MLRTSATTEAQSLTIFHGYLKTKDWKVHTNIYTLILASLMFTRFRVASGSSLLEEAFKEGKGIQGGKMHSEREIELKCTDTHTETYIFVLRCLIKDEDILWNCL